MCSNPPQIPYIPMQSSTGWQTLCSWIDIAVKCILYVLLAIALVFIFKYISSDQQLSTNNHAPISSALKCYHCIARNTSNVTDSGIPTDVNCKHKPTTIKICDAGEICWSSSFEMGATFIRSCMRKGNFAMGCHTIPKPYLTEACYCNSDLCL